MPLHSARVLPAFCTRLGIILPLRESTTAEEAAPPIERLRLRLTGAFRAVVVALLRLVLDRTKVADAGLFLLRLLVVVAMNFTF